MESCRICFAVGVRMIILGESEEKDFLMNLFSINDVNEKMSGSYFVCYECKALLSKSYNFFQKALAAQRAFLVLQGQKPGSMDIWKSFKNKYGVNSVLSYHKVEIDNFIEEKSDNPLYKEEICSKEIMKGILDPIEKTDDQRVQVNFDSKDLVSYFLKHPRESSDAQTYNLEDQKHQIELEFSSMEGRSDLLTQIEEPKNQKCHVEIGIKEEVTNLSNWTHKSEDPACRAEIGSTEGINYLLNTTHPNVSETNKKAENKPSEDYAYVETLTRPTKRILKTVTKEIITHKKRVAEASVEDQPLCESICKRKRKEDDAYILVNDSSQGSETSHDSYNDSGKILRKPPHEYPRQCELCEVTIESRANHYKHYVICHSHDLYPYKRTNPYVCQYCEIRTQKPCLLEQHEKTHLGRALPCKECDKKFYNNRELIQHQRNVHEESRFFCDHCNKEFKTKSDLRLHIRNHTGEKPFKCHLGTAGFAQSDNLDLHLKKHERLGEDVDIRPVRIATHST